ncbi:MAG: hypothetical protein HMLKMBBP_02115 [Planctomycetes bacterium]|nr:hypothetical protein [Planctomycetota bacterium]
MSQMKSTREVAEELGVRESIVHDAIRRALVTGVPRIGHVFAWDSDAVERLRAALSVRRRPATNSHEVR